MLSVRSYHVGTWASRISKVPFGISSCMGSKEQVIDEEKDPYFITEIVKGSRSGRKEARAALIHSIIE